MESLGPRMAYLYLLGLLGLLIAGALGKDSLPRGIQLLASLLYFLIAVGLAVMACFGFLSVGWAEFGGGHEAAAGALQSSWMTLFLALGFGAGCIHMAVPR
jgi:hypothetical protein